jgi:hypothetical protein
MRAIAAVVVALCCSTGCMSTYAPVSPITPLQRRAGEVSLGANVTTVHPKRGATAWLAVAPTRVARVYVAGAISRAREGEAEADSYGREMKTQNHTDQLEIGAGGAAQRANVMFETLGGAGFGQTQAVTCTPYFSAGPCHPFDSSSSFIRGFVQETFAFQKAPIFAGGFGLRLSVLRHAFDQAFGEPNDRQNWASTLEFYSVSRVGFDWGKLEVGLHLPFVIYSGHTRELAPAGREYDSRVITTPALRITLGVVTNVDRLWRKP